MLCTIPLTLSVFILCSNLLNEAWISEIHSSWLFPVVSFLTTSWNAAAFFPYSSGRQIILDSLSGTGFHEDVIKWKHFQRYWPFVREIHRSPVNSPHNGQWRGALTFSLICAWINGWVNNGEAGDLRRHWGHYDVTAMLQIYLYWYLFQFIFNSKYSHVLVW